MPTLVISVPCANAYHAKREGQPGWTAYICTSERERSLVTKAWVAAMGRTHVCGACWRAFSTHHNQRLSAGQAHEHTPFDCNRFLGTTYAPPAGFSDPWPVATKQANQKG